jgi:hypothetical protein
LRETVGVPEYQMTAALCSGAFQHEYGAPARCALRSGGERFRAGLKTKAGLAADIDYQLIPQDKTSNMLDAGEIDALFIARAPSCFVGGRRSAIV